MGNSLLNLLWLVAIGVFVIWMMRRGGCGMAMGHDRHDHDDAHARHSRSGRPIDPVCGMEVDPARPAAVRVVAGETYLLCSASCLAAFDQNAAMYTQRHESAHRHHHMGC